MMKTPEEIKKGLECCHVGECECSKCPYEKKDSCMHYLKQDALTYIRHIEKRSHLFEACYKKVSKVLCGNENKNVNAALVAARQLKSRLAQVERERDAAVRELKIAEDCYNCKHNYACKYDGNGYRNCNECGECPCSKCNSWQSQYEWRGVCEDNTKEESFK